MRDAISTSVNDNLEDGTPRRQPPSRAALFLVSLLPPIAFSELNPEGFFSALDYAGTYGVMLLFGVSSQVA